MLKISNIIYVDMHFVHTSIIIFIRTFSFVKVIEDDIYDKLLEIYKGTEMVVLVKFVEAIPFSGSHFS